MGRTTANKAGIRFEKPQAAISGWDTLIGYHFAPLRKARKSVSESGKKKMSDVFSG
jgi:hypothetical protein